MTPFVLILLKHGIVCCFDWLKYLNCFPLILQGQFDLTALLVGINIRCPIDHQIEHFSDQFKILVASQLFQVA